MKKVIDSAMETMHILGEPVSAIKAAVETIFSDIKESCALPDEARGDEEAYPARAFPDHFYVKPEPREVETAREIMQRCDTRTRADVWIPYRPKPVVEYPGQWCHCGHRWEEHMPCCVHLIEGCSCEEFMRVPMGTAEGA